MVANFTRFCTNFSQKSKNNKSEKKSFIQILAKLWHRFRFFCVKKEEKKERRKNCDQSTKINLRDINALVSLIISEQRKTKKKRE